MAKKTKGKPQEVPKEKPKEEPKETSKEEPKESPEKKMEIVSVKVKKEIVKYGGGFHDFYSGTDIYPRNANHIFKVKKTPFITRKIASGELILVSDK